MSLIDIEKNKVNGAEGIKRVIDENAYSLIIDTVSIDQYKYVEASIVRELSSNAVDSQKEKLQAVDILTGKAKVEDYYITRDDPKYKSSNFDQTYYDLNHLNLQNNVVELEYVCDPKGMGWCDKFIVRDYGVGLGDSRLYGYTSIGFSTKRNNTTQLGAYGYGAKVGLALRNDYYLTTTVHNGRKFKFQSYSYKIVSLIDRFNSNGTENPHIVFPDGSQIYYEVTSDLNFTEITVPCKRHHKEKFIQAVQSQLLYFKNVTFKVTDEDGDVSQKEFQAKVHYNSKNLIIADQFQYSRPHVVIVKNLESTEGVSYGAVDFKALEMQDLYGAVGFKCPIRQVVRNADGSLTELTPGIEVTSSRENV